MSDDTYASEAEALADALPPHAGRDPSTETWRTSLGRSTSAQLRETQTDFEDTLADLQRTQAALAASQQDLTAMQRQRDAAQDMYAEASNEARVMRKTAEQYLSQRDDALHDLAHARFQLSMTKTQLDHWQGMSVALHDNGFACSSCSGPITRGQAFQPLADAKGLFSHVACPLKEA